MIYKRQFTCKHLQNNNWAADTGMSVVEERDLDSFVLAEYCFSTDDGIAKLLRSFVKIAQKLCEYLQQSHNDELSLRRHQFYQTVLQFYNFSTVLNCIN